MGERKRLSQQSFREKVDEKREAKKMETERVEHWRQWLSKKKIGSVVISVTYIHIAEHNITEHFICYIFNIMITLNIY